jgi:hypothetical protein
MLSIATFVHFTVFHHFLNCIVWQGQSVVVVPSLIDGVAFSRLRVTSGALWLHGRHDIRKSRSAEEHPIPPSPLVPFFILHICC